MFIFSETFFLIRPGLKTLATEGGQRRREAHPTSPVSLRLIEGSGLASRVLMAGISTADPYFFSQRSRDSSWRWRRLKWREMMP